MKKALFLSFVFILLLQGCKLPESASAQKTKSAGKKQELMVVMDTTKWASQTGMIVRKMLKEPFGGLSPIESKFDLLHIQPFHFDGFIKKHRNIIIVATLDDKSPGGKLLQRFFSNSVRKKINEDPDYYHSVVTDKYATDQNVMFLFAKNDADLIKHIAKHKNSINNYFYQAALRRARDKITPNEHSTEISKYIEDKIGLKYTLPNNFIIVDSLNTDTNTVWIGSRKGNVIQNMFVTSKKYTGEDDFKVKDILQWRQNIGHQHIHAKADSTFMTHQSEIEVTQEIVPHKKYYIIRYRGLWKLNNTFKGGPFVSYAFIDKKKPTQIHYSEVYTVAVNEKSRPLLYTAEAILSSAL